MLILGHEQNDILWTIGVRPRPFQDKPCILEHQKHSDVINPAWTGRTQSPEHNSPKGFYVSFILNYKPNQVQLKVGPQPYSSTKNGHMT